MPPRAPQQPQGGAGQPPSQGQGQNWGAPPPNQYQPQRGPMRNYGNEMGAAYGSYTVGERSGHKLVGSAINGWQHFQ